MAKYIRKYGKRVQFEGADIKLDSKNRMYVTFNDDTYVEGFGVVPKGKKTILHNIDGVIKIKGVK